MPSIQSVRLKIERAEKHITDLDLAIRYFIETKPYTIGVKPHPISEIAHTTLFVESVDTVPLEISLIAGDAIHNIRSALDHLAFQLVRANGNEPTTDTYFPIGDPAKQYTSAFSQGKVEGMSVDAKKLISDIQPCHTRDLTLWHLHSLDIIDKHRFIITAQLGSNNWGVDVFSQNGPLLWFNTTSFCLMAGDEIVNLPTSTYERQKHEDFKFALDIAFGKSEILEGEPILGTLNHMAHFVRNTVSMFDRFF